MYLNYFESSNSARLFQIIDTLKNVHGVTLDIDKDSPSAESMLNECLLEQEGLRNRIMNESKFNSYQQNPEYIKCMLILEAVKIMLTEIAPKRKRRKVSESISPIQEKEVQMINQNLATQLKDISAKIPQSSSDFGPEAAFANSLSLMAQKISGENKEPLDTTERKMLSFLASLPRPVKVSDFVTKGIETFGPELVSKRKDHISTLPKIDVSEQDKDGDGDEDFADVQIARMTASGMPKSKAIAMTKDKDYNNESAVGEDPIKKYKKKQVPGLYNYTHYEDPHGNWVQVSQDKKKFVHHDKTSGKMTDFDNMDSLKKHLTTKKAVTESDGMQQAPHAPQLSPSSAKVLGQAHHYEYQASMARSELYRNAKYAMSMMKQIDPQGEVEPWIAGALTKAANILDKVYHYMDYYKKFEPEKLPENHEDVDLGETSGGVTRQNLMMIMEYSTKLFEMIRPGDKLEGWVAMKLTTASECVSSCKHYMDYVQFENHAMADHFKEGRQAASRNTDSVLNEETDIARAATIIDAKNLAGDLQDMAEEIAKASVEDLMPLVDIMRSQFGQEAADGFNNAVKPALDKLLDLTSKTKDEIEKAIDTLNKGGVPETSSDMEADAEELGVEVDKPADDTDISKDLDALEKSTQEEPEEEPSPPLGREKKPEVAESSAVSLEEAKSAKEPGAVATAQVKKMGKKYWDGKNLTKDGIRKRDEIIRAIEKETVSEEVVNEFAPKGKDAEEWITSNKEKFIKQYGKKKGTQVLYATAWKMFGKKGESYKDAKKTVKESSLMIDKLTADLERHRNEFQKLVLEGRQADPLKVGHGLEGDRIIARISSLQQKIAEANDHIRDQTRIGIAEMAEYVARKNKEREIRKIADSTPYGVIYQDQNGPRVVKMFESASTRDYWVKMHQDSVGTVKLINPENLSSMVNKIKGS